MEVLGIVFTATDSDNYKYNFESKIKNLKTTLDIWKQRSLSLKGKVAILNTLALPSLIYVSSVKDTPKCAIEEVRKIMILFGMVKSQKYQEIHSCKKLTMVV